MGTHRDTFDRPPRSTFESEVRRMATEGVDRQAAVATVEAIYDQITNEATEAAFTGRTYNPVDGIGGPREEPRKPGFVNGYADF